MSGFSPEELVGQPVSVAIPVRYRHQYRDWRKAMGVAVALARRHKMLERIALRKDGSEFPVELSVATWRTANEDFLTIVACDITGRRRAEEASARLEAIVEEASDFVVTADVDGRIEFRNRASKGLLGEAGDKTTDHLLDLFPNGAKDLIRHEAIPAALRDGSWSGETMVLRSDGEEIPVALVLVAHRGREGSVSALSAIACDLSGRKQQEQHLVYLATHDPLSGLPNRRSIEEHLQRVVARAKRGSPSSLLYIDLDNFKQVNDTLGHSAGDEALIRVVERVESELRVEDTMARLGGDEFAVLLEDTRASDARLVAERVRRAIEALDLTLEGIQFRLTLSTALTAIDGELSPVAVLARANAAMYQAKARGGNQIVDLDTDGDADTLWAARDLGRCLRQGLEAGRLELHFQPTVRLSDGKVDSYEVLVRWRDEDDKLLLPDAFLPRLERFGLSPELTRWVVQQAVRAMSDHPGVSLSVNLTFPDLWDDSFVAFVRDCLQREQVAAGRLRFEIPEAAASKDIPLAKNFVQGLNALGCRWAIDRYGTVRMPADLLRNLTPALVKVDGSFSRNVEHDPRQRLRWRALQERAIARGTSTVAVFVETQAAAEILKELGVSGAQGFFFGRPNPKLP